MAHPYQRKEVSTLLERLSERPRFLIFLEGPCQVGKTRLVRDALTNYEQDHYNFVPVDRPDEAHAPGTTAAEGDAYLPDGRQRDAAWLIDYWQRARAAARQTAEGHILVFDEIQKIPRWSETVKGLWDDDRAEGLNLQSRFHMGVLVDLTSPSKSKKTITPTSGQPYMIS